MKKTAVLSALLALALGLTACSGGNAAPAQEYDPPTTAQALLDAGIFSEALEPLDADLVPILYGLEAEPTQAVVYTSTGATAEEVAVLTFASQEEADAALEALNTRVADQKAACDGYLPAELPKLDKAIVKGAGASVLLVVADDAEGAQAALDGLMK